ncbi:MAG: rRNA maturation RNase YbeY [Limisphaerales bacterium]
MSRSVTPWNRRIVAPAAKSASSAIFIANRQRTKKINARLLRQIVDGLFAELKITEAELGINLIGAKEMAKVNWQFLQHEGSTDVITFSYKEPGARSQKPEVEIHGELFVCVDETVLQAKNFKTSWQSEIVRYIVHGVLHLLGHDDMKPALRRKMKREENRLLRLLSRRFSLAQIGRVSKIRT